MSAFRLDGAALSAQLRADFKTRAEALASQGTLPGLAVILVGEDPASQLYVRNKIAACLQAGIRSEKFEYPVDILPGVVLSRIHSLNADPNVHGILVQLPLPRQFDERAILEAIDPEKDVDGLHAANIGALLQGRSRFIPCTPYGVMKLLESAEIPLRGKEAVIVGRSNMVGKPMALLLMQAGCTITICHSQTRDLAFHTRRADILVAAMGRAHFIQGDMVKPGAVIIDVGTNRLPNGKLCGDIDAAAAEVASAYTPVPGGVGPMTITMLLANTLEAAERKAKQS